MWWRCTEEHSVYFTLFVHLLWWTRNVMLLTRCHVMRDNLNVKMRPTKKIICGSKRFSSTNVCLARGRTCLTSQRPLLNQKGRKWSRRKKKNKKTTRNGTWNKGQINVVEQMYWFILRIFHFILLDDIPNAINSAYMQSLTWMN